MSINFRTIVGLLVFMFVWSCAQHKPKSKHPNENVNASQSKFKSGLTIKNRINRGTNYTDSLGTDYSIRNIPISITNDSTVSIHLQISFSKAYNYLHPDSDEKFRLMPLPAAWAMDGVGVTESMIDELPKYIEKPLLNKTIKPGEEILLSIGSLYPRPAKTTGVLPRTLFVLTDSMIFPECVWLMEKTRLSNQPIPLGLKVKTGDKCIIIPCGSISYFQN